MNGMDEEIFFLFKNGSSRDETGNLVPLDYIKLLISHKNNEKVLCFLLVIARKFL